MLGGRLFGVDVHGDASGIFFFSKRPCIFLYIRIYVYIRASCFETICIFYNKTHNHTVVSFSENKTKNIDFLFFFLLKWKRS